MALNFTKMLGNDETLTEPFFERLNYVFKIKDDTFLRLHEQIYLMSKNSEM